MTPVAFILAISLVEKLRVRCTLYPVLDRGFFFFFFFSNHKGSTVDGVIDEHLPSVRGDDAPDQH